MFILLILTLFLFSNKISKMIVSSIILVIYLSNNFFLISMNSWISMSMFLALVGGLLVLFSLVFSIFMNSLEKSSGFLPISILIFFLMKYFNSYFLGSIPPISISLNIFITFFLLLILNFSLMLISKMILMSEKSFRSSFSQLKLIS